jgi:hypothetical protein
MMSSSSSSHSIREKRTVRDASVIFKNIEMISININHDKSHNYYEL